MPLIQFLRGSIYEVLTYEKPSGRNEVLRYLAAMQRPERIKMQALIQKAADFGPDRLPRERCRFFKEEDFNELKTFGHRVTWAIVDRKIILLTAFEKKSDETPAPEVIKAANAVAAMLEEYRKRK